MKIKEVFCDKCFNWWKVEQLEKGLGGGLYCGECKTLLAISDKHNPEKEREFTIRLKGIDERFNWLMYDVRLKIYVFAAFGNRDCQNIFTEEQLSRDGLAHLLYNDAFEVSEVK